MVSSEWAGWARTLQQKHMTGLVITLMEGFSPFRLILAQVMLGFSPFFNDGNSKTLRSFAELMENQSDSRSFVTFLREERTIE
jgi:hypothetical protein